MKEEFISYLYEKTKAYGRVKRFYRFELGEEVRKGWEAETCEKVRDFVERPGIGILKDLAEKRLKKAEEEGVELVWHRFQAQNNQNPQPKHFHLKLFLLVHLDCLFYGK